jgi:lipopolysaccharide export system protein LptA
MKDYEAEAVRIEANLGAGTARIPGPGVGRDRQSGQRISWAEQADFEFRVEKDPQTGKERIAGLKTAEAQGKTAMAVKDASVLADSMRAEFVPAGEEGTTLERVLVKGNVTAGDGRSQSLSCDEGEMGFKPGKSPREPDPTSFTASGHVVARDGPAVASADSMHATLERRPDGEVAVTRAVLMGGAHFAQDDGVRPRIEADAAELDADPVKRVVDLIGAEGAAAKVVRGGAVLTGRSIRLDGMANGASVDGVGTFVNGPDKRTPDGPRVTASWTKEMRFDDTAGTLYAAGDVAAEVATDPLSLDKIRAERVDLAMTPGQGPSEGDSAVVDEARAGSLGMDPTGGGRKLIRARAEGAAMDVEGGANATAESWRFIADKAAPEGRRPERVLYLEGPLIMASDAEQMLDVEGPGRLLVVDRRYFDGSAGAAARGEESGLGASLNQGAVGGSIFAWQGSMHLDRDAGSVHFVERVRLNHRPQRDASLMELECEDLTAKIAERGEGPEAQSVDGELESADARGAVWARSAARELIADRLNYDARTGKAEAEASEGNRVTVYDRVKATSITAARILWDLAGDRIEVISPGTVTAPK